MYLVEKLISISPEKKIRVLFITINNKKDLLSLLSIVNHQRFYFLYII